MAGADRRNLAKELSSLVELSNTRARFAKAGRTLQAAYELTSLDQELSSRVKAVEKRRATAPQDPEMTADQRTAARQAAKLKKQEEEARQREWEARYTTPVADCMSFRKTSTRLAAAKACLTNGASHIFCCLTDSDQEYLARQISLNTSAFAIKGTTIVVEGGNAGLMVFLHRGTVGCFSREAARQWGSLTGPDALGDRIAAKSAPAIISETSLVAGLPWTCSIVAETDCEVLAISREQLRFLLQEAKTEANVTSHFAFLAQRADVPFRPFVDEKSRASKLPCFANIFQHPTLPQTLQPLIEPTAARLLGMNRRIVIPALEQTQQDISVRTQTEDKTQLRGQS